MQNSEKDNMDKKNSIKDSSDDDDDDVSDNYCDVI